MSFSAQKISLGLSTKRKRDPVFTSNEKKLLIELVEEHFDVIECKRTDGVSTKLKLNEWATITTQFNASTDYMQRDVQALKNLWDNLKKKAKSTMTIINGNRFATGGGPTKDLKDDPIIEKVMSLIKANVQGLNNNFDSDAVVTTFENPENSTVLFEEVIAEDGEYQEHAYAKDLEPQVQDFEWSNYTPALLRTPRTKILIEDGQPIIECVVESKSDSTSSSSSSLQLIKTEIKKPKVECTTPRSMIKSSRHIVNRRRPVLKESEAVALATTKINTLKTNTEQAQQQHEVQMRCLLLQEEQEKEKLLQEKERTEQGIIKKKILLAQLAQLTNK